MANNGAQVRQVMVQIRWPGCYQYKLKSSLLSSLSVRYKPCFLLATYLVIYLIVLKTIFTWVQCLSGGIHAFYLTPTYLGRRLLALVGSEDPRDALCVFSHYFNCRFHIITTLSF